MGDIWQEHRRFILSLVLGALAFLIVWLIISGIYSSEIKLYERKITKSKRTQRQALPAGASLRGIRRERQQEEEQFNQTRARIQRVPSEGYVLAQGSGSADLQYSRQVNLMRRGVVELCALKNIAVDQNLGLPSKFPGTRKEKNRYLMGLDVIRQILLLALEADQVMEGGIVRVDNIQIKSERSRRTTRREKFIELLPVSMTIIGHPMAVDRMLRDLPLYGEDGSDAAASTGRFLTVVGAVTHSLDQPQQKTGTRRRTYRDPADSNRVRLELNVAAVIVNQSGRLEGVRP